MVNTCARRRLEKLGEHTYRQRVGNMLECINALSNENGCGHSDNCAECVIRRVLAGAFDGTSVCREKAVVQLRGDDGFEEVHMRVTASPILCDGRDEVVLILEDVTGLIQLIGLIPICAWCGRVKEGEDYHKSLIAYLRDRLDVGFTHGLCPDCAKGAYPDYQI